MIACCADGQTVCVEGRPLCAPGQCMDGYFNSFSLPFSECIDMNLQVLGNQACVVQRPHNAVQKSQKSLPQCLRSIIGEPCSRVISCIVWLPFFVCSTLVRSGRGLR
jgi:hypothetical protein